MTGEGERSTIVIQPDILAGQLGVDPAVANEALALLPLNIVDTLAVAVADHERALGDRYEVDEGISTLLVLGEEIDLENAAPETRAAAAVYGMRLLGKLGITKFDIGEAK